MATELIWATIVAELGRLYDAAIADDDIEQGRKILATGADVYGAQRSACVRAGLGRFEDPKARTGYVGLIPHDFRRSAVRNLERSGVPRSIAMELVGHVTESIYRSYAITDETSLREGVAKLEERFGERPAPTRKVAPLDR